MNTKIVKLIPSFHQGGSESQAIQLLEILKDIEGIRVELACLDREGVLRSRVDELGFKDFPTYPLTSFYDLNFVRQLYRFVKFLKEKESTIIETSDFYTNVFGLIAAAIARVPVRIGTKRETGSRSKAQSFLERFAFRFADVIIANSEAVRTHLVENGVDASKIEVIYNAVDLKSFTIKKTRRQICESLGLPVEEEIRFVTIIANFRSENKNQRMFLRAAQKVSETIGSARFVLAGEGELLDAHKKFADELGIGKKCFFPGRIERTEELLFATDVCVLTSRFEGFSNSIIEYMAASKPVVATAVGGAAEAIEDSRTGFLVAPEDHLALAKRLVELLEDGAKSERFGQGGYALAKARFSVETRRDKTLALYERLLNTIVERTNSKHIVSTKSVN